MQNYLKNSVHKKDVLFFSEEQRDKYFLSALCDILSSSMCNNTFTLVVHDGEKDSDVADEGNCSGSEDGESSPKKQKFSDEDFHQNLRWVALISMIIRMMQTALCSILGLPGKFAGPYQNFEQLKHQLVKKCHVNSWSWP